MADVPRVNDIEHAMTKSGTQLIAGEQLVYIQGTAEYNASDHDGEGRPSKLRFAMTCREGIQFALEELFDELD